MKLLIPLLLLPLLCPARAAAAPAKADCAKSSDACYAGRRLSPFMEAVKAVEAAAETKAPAETKPDARPQAPSPVRESPVPAAAVPGAAPAAPARAEEGALSHPAWLLFIAGSLAGLYFYLRAPARRKGGRR